MFGSRTISLLAAGAVSALTLGGVATFLRLLPESATTLPSAVTFALCVVAVAAGVAVGTREQPGETAYW